MLYLHSFDTSTQHHHFEQTLELVFLEKTLGGLIPFNLMCNKGRTQGGGLMFKKLFYLRR